MSSKMNSTSARRKAAIICLLTACIAVAVHLITVIVIIHQDDITDIRTDSSGNRMTIRYRLLPITEWGQSVGLKEEAGCTSAKYQKFIYYEKDYCYDGEPSGLH
jgi:hypothetical protein